MDPEEIVAAIPLTLFRKWKAGDHRQTRRGQPLEGVYERSYCCFVVPISEESSLSESLLKFCVNLGPSFPFLRSIREEGGSAELFLSWFTENNSGNRFGWKLLNQLAEGGIDFSLDVYPYLPQSSQKV